jgi:Berberine and berberine like
VDEGRIDRGEFLRRAGRVVDAAGLLGTGWPAGHSLAGRASARPPLGQLARAVQGPRAMRPFVSGFAYQNHIDPDLAALPHAYYGANLARLVDAKTTYDPDEVFRFRQGIRAA